MMARPRPKLQMLRPKAEAFELTGCSADTCLVRILVQVWNRLGELLGLRDGPRDVSDARVQESEDQAGEAYLEADAEIVMDVG